MTAHATTQDREGCLAAGMDDHIAKPLRRKDFMAKVEKWLRGQGKGESSPAAEQATAAPIFSVAPSSAPLDLGRAIEEFDNDREFLLGVLREFLLRGRSQIASIRQALTAKEFESVVATALRDRDNSGEQLELLLAPGGFYVCLRDQGDMKILIVEDELVSRKKMEKLLQGLGYETLVACDGEEGLNIWLHERPKIVITDWVMPRLSGLDLCCRIRSSENADYTYIIMVTPKSGTGDLVAGMEAGADDFITKPFNKDELSVRIRAGERMISSQSMEVVIFALAKLAESRDEDTGFHLERIRYYSKVLAETIAALNDQANPIDQNFIDNIYHTSPLHDIGKIGIPDYILLKPGRLAEHEFEAMKRHSVIGHETLNEALVRYPHAGYLRMSAQIALSHHEKYNGTGYPQGLAGARIPLSARIVSLADVYDALICQRVYKQAFSHEIAKSIILEEKGLQFDPMIVDAFLDCEDRFVEISKRFKD